MRALAIAMMTAWQISKSDPDLAGVLGTASPFWPRNGGPSWPSSEPKALAERLLEMCRAPRDNLHPFAYWVMAPWGAEGRDGQMPFQGVEMESANLFRCNVGYPLTDDVDRGWPVKDFLNIVWLLGLRVVIGLDAALYAQDSYVCAPQRPCGPAGICFLQRYACYDNARTAWRRMLKSGLVEDSQYHPALQFVVLQVEPEVAVPLQCQAEGVECAWPQILRGAISAWDAIIDAELELGVHGSVNFTVTFNVTENVAAKGLPKCFFLRHPEGCAEYHDLRNMWLGANDLLADDYVPHNNMSEVFTNRWVHSLNAKMSPEDLRLHLQEFYSFVNPVEQNTARALAFYPS